MEGKGVKISKSPPDMLTASATLIRAINAEQSFRLLESFVIVDAIRSVRRVDFVFL